jgi:hypothetical protein
MLRDKRIYFSDPLDVNDPWDCKPFLKDAPDRISHLLQAEVVKRRIYCLTPFPENTLMWSHYGDKHRGIAIEFGKDNPLISKARPVSYSKDYPEWTWTAIWDGNPLRVILNKSADWCYEREFRLIGVQTTDGSAKLDGNYVALPDGAVTAIVLGCENRLHDEVRKILDDYAPAVSIKRIIREQSHYRLKLVG